MLFSHYKEMCLNLDGWKEGPRSKPEFNLKGVRSLAYFYDKVSVPYWHECFVISTIISILPFVTVERSSEATVTLKSVWLYIDLQHCHFKKAPDVFSLLRAELTSFETCVVLCKKNYWLLRTICLLRQYAYLQITKYGNFGLLFEFHLNIWQNVIPLFFLFLQSLSMYPHCLHLPVWCWNLTLVWISADFVKYYIMPVIYYI